jgi:hypothetical protein
MNRKLAHDISAGAAGEQSTKEPNMSTEVKKPVVLRADAIPTDGYVLSVDNKLKARYETAAEAMTAGTKLKQSFPAIQVSVFDAAERTYQPIELAE